MNSQRLTTTLLVIISTVLIILLILIAAPYILKLFSSTGEQTEIGYSSETVRAEVIAIQEEGVTEVAGNEQTYQVLEVQILEGEFAQSRTILEIGKSQVLPADYRFKTGDKLLISAGTNPIDGQLQAYFVDYVRENAIILLFFIFCAVTILIGGKTGFRSLIGSIIGLGIIILFVIPQLIQGKNPLMVSIIGSAIFLTVSLYVVFGWRAMTHTAVVGMFISLFLTGGFSIIATRMTRLTGFGNEDMMFLVQQSERYLDTRDILLASIIIGSLGVLDDLVVGQSSSVFQLHSANPDFSFIELFRRAMTIGRDHVAAAVNTLILAYAGGSLPMLLLFSITNVNLRMAVNVSFIAEEIVRALAGTTGLFLSVPITTIIACLWVKRFEEKTTDP